MCRDLRTMPSEGRRRAGDRDEHATAVTATTVRLRVDPIACDAFGYCVELLPEIVGLDEWGFPVLDDGPVPAYLVELARRAVRDCPRRALLLERLPPGSR